MLETEGIDVKHCGTDNMIANFLTKPLHGALFRRMRDIIMSHVCFPTEERVEDYRKLTKIAVGAKGDVSVKRPAYADILKRR